MKRFLVIAVLFCGVAYGQTDYVWFPQTEQVYHTRRIDNTLGEYAPVDAQYLVSAATGQLSAEDVVTEGFCIDYFNGAGTGTFSFDPTEFLGSQTWGDASTDTIVWTWNRATGTDPTMTFNSGSIGLQALTLTTDLAVTEGGTGASTLTDHGVLLGSGTGAITPTAAGTTGQVLTGVTGSDPVWASAGISTTTRIINTDSPYTVLASDYVIFCDTDAGVITANLPAGVEGRHYKLINCGSSGNDLTVDPDGTEQLYGGGAGVSQTLSDGEVINIHFNATEGWW